MELYYVMSIVDRSKAAKMLEIHQELDLSVVLTNLGEGTATSTHLLLYDLQQTEKAIISSVATGPSLRKLFEYAKRKLYVDIPGNGIVLAIPIKSVSGGRTLAYLTDGQDLEGSVPAMDFENELIVVILNEGYTDTVMDVARGAGATGGTVFHVKGTGKKDTEKFYGVSLVDEKDMIYILAPSNKKSGIMKAINQVCGVQSPSGAISFSIPVSEVAGLRIFSES